ncbi:MAG: stage III sporulation protein AF [Oscillospiraceae bacterium]|nr:stage III sporulation protein AF [Oscillospiraceae bacterium]
MREILLNICIVAVAAALFKMLVPDNSFKKQIGFLISCFFITSVVSFVTSGRHEFGGLSDIADVTIEGGFTDFTEQTLAQRKQAIAGELSSRVRQTLEENGIEPVKIYVIVNISGLYSISINEIKLVLPPDGDFARASALVEKEVGRNIKVTFEVDER